MEVPLKLQELYERSCETTGVDYSSARLMFEQQVRHYSKAVACSNHLGRPY